MRFLSLIRIKLKKSVPIYPQIDGKSKIFNQYYLETYLNCYDLAEFKVVDVSYSMKSGLTAPCIIIGLI